jgi:hypothetical protein
MSLRIGADPVDARDVAEIIVEAAGEPPLALHDHLVDRAGDRGDRRQLLGRMNSRTSPVAQSMTVPFYLPPLQDRAIRRRLPIDRVRRMP